MELKEMIKVMQHFDNGGEVEFSRDNFKTILGTANKKYDGHLSWDWDTYDYRIKDEKEKVTIEKWLFRDKQGDFLVIEISNAEKEVYSKFFNLSDSCENANFIYIKKSIDANSLLIKPTSKGAL